MSELRWWRVEVDTNGTIVSVKEAPRGLPVLRVYYTEAASRDVACRAAYNLYCSEKQRQKRQRHADEGKCRCGRTPKPGFRRCAVCLERGKSERDRRKQRNAPMQRNEAARLDNNAKRRRDRHNEVRLELLLELRSKLQDTSTIQEVRDWVESEIASATVPRTEAAE